MIERLKLFIQKFLPKNSFMRGVSVLVGGTTGEQILLVIAAPILTRIYAPEDFGLLAIYVSLLALLNVISSLRYQLAIPLPKDEVEAANIAILGLLLVFLTAIITGLLVLIFSDVIAELLGVPSLTFILWLLPISVLLSGTYTIFNYWAIRTKFFSAIASTKLVQTIALLVTQFTTFKLGGIGLIVGQIVGHSFGTARLAKLSLRMSAFKHVSRDGIFKVAKRYKQFPLFSTWGGFIDTASLKIPTIVIFSMFGPIVAGLLSLAERVLQMPISLIGGSVGQVFLSSAPEANREGKLKVFVEKISSKLIHIGLPPALLIFLTGPELFAIIFGENWRQAGEFAKWITPWLYFQFISSPLSTIFVVTEKMGQSLTWQTILFLTNLIAVLVGISLGDATKTIISLSVANVGCYLALLIWVAHLSKNSSYIIFKPMLSAFLLSIICVSPLLLSAFFLKSSTIISTLSFLASLLLIFVRYYILALGRS